MKLFGKNFIFRVKSTNFLFFQDQMYIFWYKTTVFIQNLYFLLKYFGINLIFRVKSTNFFWGDQMYIFGYKTTVFIQNLYILVNFFGKNFIFSVKSTIVLVFRDQMYICIQNYSFYPKFVHFSKFFWQKLHF